MGYFSEQYPPHSSEILEKHFLTDNAPNTPDLVPPVSIVGSLKNDVPSFWQENL